MKPGLRSCSRLAAAVTITLTLTVALVGCGPSTPAFPDRQPGARAPLSSTCDPIDPSRCALPWPSNTFTVADASTKTGLKLAIDRRALLGGEDVSFLNVADGFSRMSPMMTAFPGALSQDSLGSGADTAMR